MHQVLYQDYFGLKEAPFSIAPNPQYLYMSDRHREALAHLLYGVQSDGAFILLTGEVGTGKTTICRSLLQQLPDEIDTAFIINPKLTADELLAAICDDLQISYPANATCRTLVDCLNTYLVQTVNNDRRTLLIIDEAQNLSEEVLEQLRLLTNLETNQQKLLQIVLLGQPELLDKLLQPSLRQLTQRITARFHLEALDRSETDQYIAHRLSVAGARDNLFRRSALRRVYQHSGGIPRVINLICDRALLGAFAENKSMVAPRIVNKAAQEVLASRRISHGWQPALAAALVLTVVVIAWLSQSVEETAPAAVAAASIDTTEQTVIANVTPVSATPESRLTMAAVQGHAEQRRAFDDLFALWGIYLEDEENTACEVIERIGLACLGHQGGVSQLVKLNRPAIIQLQNNDEWITVSRMDDSNVTLIAGNREYSISKAVLSENFDGGFTVLWRMPPAYQSPASLGAMGADVDWLAAQFALIDNRDPTRTMAHSFDAELEARVRRFQQSVNLPATGIVDPISWIHLNSAHGINIPLLSNNSGER
jgi:general secretion pathway protein A